MEREAQRINEANAIVQQALKSLRHRYSSPTSSRL